MSKDPDNVIRGVWSNESKKVRTADGNLGHDELRDRWIERYPNRSFSGGIGGSTGRVGGGVYLKRL